MRGGAYGLRTFEGKAVPYSGRGLFFGDPIVRTSAGRATADRNHPFLSCLIADIHLTGHKSWMLPLFTGLSAFTLTPADARGVVDTDAIGILVDRLVHARPDSIALLGSTGIYAYLDKAERSRAVAAAIEAVGGRIPVIVGIGALRTVWSQDLAIEAERLGTTGLLMAPMSYTPLTQEEAANHYRSVAASTDLPLCIYNNPGTTHFIFSDDLIVELATIPTITGIKMPRPSDEDYANELDRLRQRVPETFKIGYSGDWNAAGALLEGGDAWYSVVAGLLPEPATRLTRAAQAGRTTETIALDSAFRPLWNLFREHGSLRIMYAIADHLSLVVGDPPLPLRRVGTDIVGKVEEALATLVSMSSAQESRED